MAPTADQNSKLKVTLQTRLACDYTYSLNLICNSKGDKSNFLWIIYLKFMYHLIL